MGGFNSYLMIIKVIIITLIIIKYELNPPINDLHYTFYIIFMHCDISQYLMINYGLSDILCEKDVTLLLSNKI